MVVYHVLGFGFELWSIRPDWEKVAEAPKVGDGIRYSNRNDYERSLEAFRGNGVFTGSAIGEVQTWQCMRGGEFSTAWRARS